jgi:superfamily II DNA/RNA helicase
MIRQDTHFNSLDLQVMGVLDAMPSSNLKPEEEDGVLEENRVYRTTYMFSATMPPPVERLARKYMRRPAVINIGSAGKATDNVTQKAIPPLSCSRNPCFWVCVSSIPKVLRR